MANPTTFKQIHDIPMDKMTFDRISDDAEFPKNNQKYLRGICAIIKYDEELQIASFESFTPFSIEPIEQGSEYIIITMNCQFNELPKRYLISKRTGDIYENVFDQIKPYNDLMDGLMYTSGGARKSSEPRHHTCHSSTANKSYTIY